MSHLSFHSHPAKSPECLTTKRPSSLGVGDEDAALVMGPNGTFDTGLDRGATTTAGVDFDTAGCPPMISA